METYKDSEGKVICKHQVSSQFGKVSHFKAHILRHGFVGAGVTVPRLRLSLESLGDLCVRVHI